MIRGDHPTGLLFREAGFLTLIALLCYLPFLDKGPSNDDLVFLDYATRLTLNPTVCEVGDYMWLGHLLEDLVVFESTHPPLVPYVIRVVTHLFGHSLPLLHLAFFGFLCLATLSVGDLIRRYSGLSPLLALGVTLGPMVLPNATSLMTDTALLAFWFGAMAAW